MHWDRKFREPRDWTANKERLTDSLGMEEVEGIGYLTKIRPDHVWREAIGIAFYELEEIGWGSWVHVDWGNAWHDKIIVVDVFKKVGQWANVGVAFDLRAL